MFLLLTFRPPLPRKSFCLFVCLFRPKGIFVDFRHFFVTGFVKNTLACKRSPIWASEVSLARTRERGPLARSRETRFTRPNKRACSQVTLTTLFNITFTVLIFTVIVKKVLLKVLPQVRGGNDDRSGIYSFPTKVLSDDDILFVYPLRGALAKKMRVRITRDGTIFAKKMAISMEPTPLLEKVSSYGLLPRLWLLEIYIVLLKLR